MKNIARKPSLSRGFALVVTLSLMILLTVIAVGLLTLSSISLRSANQTSDGMIARSNARVALMLALGDLQKAAGQDTRITARADILKADNPPLTGVWKSWEGTNHELTGSAMGRPVSPGDYQAKKRGRFLSWLVSGDPLDLIDPTQVPDAAKSAGKVTLVGDNTVGAGADRQKLQVHLTPTTVTSARQQGAFAWWISGENQKARLPKPFSPESDDNARWAVNSKSHSIADPKPFDLEDCLTDFTLGERSISLKTADLHAKGGADPTSRTFFHDLTTSSIGLQTNVATGGWKKDLSLFTEGPGSVGTGNLPFFRVKPGQDIIGSLPTSGNPTAVKSMIYPWAAYRGSASDPPIYRHGAVSSWENLRDYALAYQRITTPSSGKWRITPVSTSIYDDAFTFLHKVRVLPLIARIQWVLSHTAGPPSAPGPGQPPHPPGSLEPRLLVTPVVTMWNPYNVEMNVTNVPMEFNIAKPLPLALRYTLAGGQNAGYNSLTSGGTNNSPALASTGALAYRIGAGFSLKPGETRVFSPPANQVAAGVTLELQPGYRSRGGHYFGLKKDGMQSGWTLAVPASGTIKAAARFDTTYEESSSLGTSTGVGIYLDLKINGREHLAYRMVYKPTVATSIYKPITGLAESPPLSSIQSNPSPFMTTVFGARMASRTHIAAKGFVQSSPLVNYTAMGGKDVMETTIGRHYAGTDHPVNSPFDYSFQAVAGAGDSLLPNESDTTGRGYIVTGFTKADGLSRCVIGELPTRPLHSLAELQNWDLRYENPIPPFAFNLIGNSDATPLIASNKVTGGFSDAVNLQHDDSYCANHVLFDDWFFSSIARDPTTFGMAGKTIQNTYADFLTGVAPLGNRAYLPLTEDAAAAAVSPSAANLLYSKYVNRSDAWKKIASRLEVEGMFNVNSTSVTAWRALLGHARNQKVPFIEESGGSWGVGLSAKSDHAFSRFSIAGDSEAKSQGSSGAFPEAAEFAGYRLLDEDIIDALAAEIVRQVRLRGPFLSLAEFINRQLSSGDLALAGAVQSALNEIAKKSATNPYSGITSVISRSAAANPEPAGSSEYKYPAAAVGESTYGLPGWTRQADVLRPLAPILTARDDTFTIRAYGDARDAKGAIKAKATCEAVVRRTREYVDAADAADITTLPVSPVNRAFGRRFEIVSFRWLGQAEL